MSKGHVLSRWEKRLLWLLLFLLPTQLGKHFWPPYSFVSGIRVDYLSPALYFTDVLFLLLLFLRGLRILKSKSKPLRVIKIRRKEIIFFIVTIVIVGGNVYFSTGPWLAVLKWLIILKLLAFFIYVSNLDTETLNDITAPLLASVIFFFSLGLLQFYFQKTLGGIFYLFGERSFSIQSPGIALFDFLGQERMRSYSTFPHPNSFAGYYLVLTILLLGFKRVRKEKKKIASLLLILLLTFLITYSKAAMITFMVISILLTIHKKIKLGINVYLMFLYLAFVLSVFSPIFFKTQSLAITGTQALERRVSLSIISEKMFSQNPFFGVGMNNFVPELSRYSSDLDVLWFLQPVHNIFLLALAEAGLSGGLLFLTIVSKGLLGAFKKSYFILLAVMAVILTGLFDHYWLTLNQNMMLFTLVLAISFSKKVSGKIFRS